MNIQLINVDQYDSKPLVIVKSLNYHGNITSGHAKVRYQSAPILKTDLIVTK